MAKNILRTGLLFWLALFLSSFGANRIEQRKKVQQVYTSQIGVRELTGHNDGAEIRRYLADSHQKEGVAWCGAFVTWVFDSAGVETRHSAWAPAWYNSHEIIYKHGWKEPKSAPQPGDVVMYYDVRKRRIGHVGFFDKTGVKYCETVEGNTGQGAGQGVHRIKRLWGSFYAIANHIDNQEREKDR